MASVLLGIDDPQANVEIIAPLEAAGHAVEWVGALEVTPRPGQASPDLVIVDGEAPGMDLAVVAAAWTRRDPAPALLVLGHTARAREASERLRIRFLIKPVDRQELVDEIERTAYPRGTGSLSPAEALRVLGQQGGGLPEDEAATIAAGARTVDLAHVRESLRPRMHDYATATPLLERLCARRTLSPAEARLAQRLLDGGTTVRGAIDGAARVSESVPEAMPAYTAARLLWGLISGGAVTLAPEPPFGHPTTRLRSHLQARAQRLLRANHYAVLEVGLDAGLADLDRSLGLLEVRYGPAATAPHDLGNLTPLAARVWERVVRARQVLGDPHRRAAYDQVLLAGRDLEEVRARRRRALEDAERSFVRGQQALAAGEVFRAVSDFAAAARRVPDIPDFEVYGAWARVLAAEARGEDRTAVAKREREKADRALLGRRPRPRAELVAGLLCEATGDLVAAAAYHRDALAVDDKLAAARQALARLGR